MSDTPTPKSTKGRKPKHASGIPGALKGKPIPAVVVPAMLTAEFAAKNSALVLELVFGHAANDPTTARWLCENLFPVGGWAPMIPAMVGPNATHATLEAAKAGVLDAYVAGHISAEALASITDGLLARMEALHGAAGVKSGISDHEAFGKAVAATVNDRVVAVMHEQMKAA